MTTPYQPPAGQPNPLRGLYNAVGLVLRLTTNLQADGTFSAQWNPVTSIVDPYQDAPGQVTCRLELGFIRAGKDQLPALVAGRPPDRVGVLYCDLLPDENGMPLIQAGDRVKMVAGPIYGTFEIRTIPDVAQAYAGAHHIEVQVVEVAQALAAGSPQPFPGSPA